MLKYESISQSKSDGCLIITVKRKSDYRLTYLIDSVEIYVQSFGDYRIECFYLSKNCRLSDKLDFKTDVSFELFIGSQRGNRE